MTPTRDEIIAHEQARMLAAEAVDGPLAPEEASWLDEHLAACGDCRAIAEEYRAIHFELSGLAMPEPPRDLWARTRAAFDAMDASSGGSRARQKTHASRTSLLGSSIAVAVVVLVAGASLLGQTPISRPVPGTGGPGTSANGSAAGPTPGPNSNSPLAVVNGTTYWISGQDGVYQIKGGTSACNPGDASCTVKDGGGQTLGTIASDSTVSAALAPNASVAAVWTTDKVVILPLNDAGPTVSLDLLTPQPTLAATPTPSATPTATPTPVATSTVAASQEPSGPPATAAIVTPQPSATPTPIPTPVATPVPTPSPTATPTAKPTAASTSGATAILAGFEIVGPDPEFSPDGRIVAFSARPSDHSAGPDVFIWQTGDRQAHAITAGHSDLFSGWFGTRILISEISAPASSGGAAASPAAGSVTSTSYVFDPASGQELRITRPMLMPVVDPSGRYVVYWSGTVEFDQSSDLWQPGGGDLFFDKWSNLQLVPVGVPAETATPSPVTTSSPEPSPSASPSSETSVGPSPSASQSIAPVGSPTETAQPAFASPLPVTSAEPTATPAATPAPTATPQPKLPQLLPVAADVGSVKVWQVTWDATGQHVALWVADQGSAKVGRLSLFSVNSDTDLVDTDNQLLRVDRVISSLQFDAARLLYTSAVDGKTYLQAIPPWSPSTVATPGAVTGSPQPGTSPTPISTDRPGD